jgi:polyisoprenoid-binding protein YceI
MTRSRLIVGAVVLLLVVAIGGYVVYDQVLRGDTVQALALPTASPATGASAAPGASTIAAASFDGTVAGTWTVTTGSQAGYRVREQLANLPAQSDAVGRTDKVSGTLTVEGDGTTTMLTAASLEVDMTSLTSDKSQRDNRLRNEGLQTDAFPTATFKLTQPVGVPAAAIAGTASDVTLTGDLTIHGVTKSVQIPAQVQLSNGTIQVAGSISFPLSDYQIVAPNIGGVIVSIADDGAMEFLVVFAKS